MVSSSAMRISFADGESFKDRLNPVTLISSDTGGAFRGGKYE